MSTWTLFRSGQRRRLHRVLGLLAMAAGTVHAKPTRLTFQELETIAFQPAPPPSDAFSGVLRTAPELAGTLPAALLALDGQPIAIRGFMYPMDYLDGRSREFLFMPFDMTCHFGDWPGLAHFMVVEMEGNGEPVFLHDPVTLTGILHLRETWEAGTPVGLLYVDGFHTRRRE